MSLAHCMFFFSMLPLLQVIFFLLSYWIIGIAPASECFLRAVHRTGDTWKMSVVCPWLKKGKRPRNQKEGPRKAGWEGPQKFTHWNKDGSGFEDELSLQKSFSTSMTCDTSKIRYLVACPGWHPQIRARLRRCWSFCLIVMMDERMMIFGSFTSKSNWWNPSFLTLNMYHDVFFFPSFLGYRKQPLRSGEGCSPFGENRCWSLESKNM